MDTSDTTRNVVRSLETIGKLLSETQLFWAKPLGVSVPQWLIIVAIDELDVGAGVPVAEVAKRCRVDPSFVTAQTKLLEKAGFVDRRQSSQDGRVILMSLTKQTKRELGAVEARRKALNRFIFSDLSETDLGSLLASLELLEKRFLKAPLVLALDA